MTNKTPEQVAKDAAKNIENYLLKTRFSRDFIDSMIEFVNKEVLRAVLESHEEQDKTDAAKDLIKTACL